LFSKQRTDIQLLLDKNWVATVIDIHL